MILKLFLLVIFSTSLAYTMDPPPSEIRQRRLESQQKLMSAVQRDSLEEIKVLRAYSSYVDGNGDIVLCVDENGNNPLHVVQSAEAATLLLGQQPALARARNLLGRTPLNVTQNPAIAQLLIAYGAPVDERDHNGNTLLHTAQNPDFARLLIANGVRVHVPNNRGNTPLHIAANAAMVNFFIDEQHANPQATNGHMDDQPVHTISNPQALQALLDKQIPGIDVNTRNAVGQTPLHRAPNAEIVATLLGRGADIYARDLRQRTVLHTVSNEHVLNCLLTYVAPPEGAHDERFIKFVNATDSDGNTAFHTAQNAAIARRLIVAHAEVNVLNGEGLTPFGRLCRNLRNLAENSPEYLNALGLIRFYIGENAVVNPHDQHQRRAIRLAVTDPQAVERLLVGGIDQVVEEPRDMPEFVPAAVQPEPQQARQQAQASAAPAPSCCVIS